MTIKICNTSKREICFVSLLILATLFCRADSAAMAFDIPPAVQIGPGETPVDSDSIITTNNRYGMHAENANAVISAGDRLRITTVGDGSHGAYANYFATILIGNSADISVAGDYTNGIRIVKSSDVAIGNGAAIVTSGIEAHAVFMQNNATIKIGSGANFATSGDGAVGVYAQHNSSVDIGEKLTIKVSGLNSYGAYAFLNTNITIGDSATITSTGYGTASYNKSNVTIGSGAIIKTSGNSGHGVYNYTDATTNIGSGATIITSGASAYGVIAMENSTVTIGDSATITTSSHDAFGIYSYFDGSNVKIGHGAIITTLGDRAVGATANDNAGVDIGNGAQIITSGVSSYGLYARDSSTIKFGNSADITTSGAGGYGLYARDGSTIQIGNSVKITTSGTSAYGLYAREDSHVKTGNGVQITTSGDNAYGALAYDKASIEVGSGSKIATSADRTHGVIAWTNSSLDIGESSVITTLGYLAHGVFALDNSKIEFGKGANIAATGEEAHAIYAYNNSSLRLNGGTISATGANALAVYSELDSQVTGEGQFSIIGDMYADGTGGAANTLIAFTLEDGSTFTGKTSYSGSYEDTKLNLTLNGIGTLWDVTADSDLTNLYMNGATVDLTHAAFGARLIVENLGQSGSDNGVFKMETHIVEEDADLLIVNGEAKGHYILDISNSGGDAATGLELTDLVFIEREGQSVVFELDHIVECGGWQFALAAPDRDTTQGRALHRETTWYLYATGDSSTAGSGAINSFAGSYLMAYAETNTLMQRMGDLRDSEYLSGFWFRVHGGKFESNSKSYVRGFDMKYGGVQIGYDRKIENSWDGDIYAGVMFGYSRGDLDYSHEGSGKVDSKALGIYGVYVRPDGFYVDAVLKYQWMNNDFDVIDTAGTLVRGNDVSTGGIGASIEVGKRFHLAKGKENGNGWYAEPQIQLSYQHQDGGYFNATNGLNIGVDSFTSLLGRVGVLIGYETDKTNVYAKVSKVKEFDGDLKIHANGVPIADSFGDNWWVYGVGFTSRIDDKNSLHLDIERTSGGSFRQPWRINAGWRIEL